MSDQDPATPNPKLVRELLNAALTDLLGGPAGGPDICHVDGAASIFMAMDELGLEIEDRDDRGKYLNGDNDWRIDFFDRNKRQIPKE